VSCTIVAAVAENGVIGRDNDLPWHLPEDLKRFKALTLGRTLLMGRRTFDSIGRPLPGRRTVVLTRDPDWRHEGVEVVHTLAEARDVIRDRDVVLAGGGQLYAALFDEVDRLELTEVHRNVEGDTVFPVLDPTRWRETARHDRDGYSFVSYRRTGADDADQPTT
jgi:dihydrofolate reductase